MKLHEILEQSYHTFLEQAQNTRLLLLHPDSRYRSMLIAKLINSDDFDVYYYAMGLDDIDLQTFLTSITNSLSNQHVMFGRHINILPHRVFENPMENFDLILDTFVQDLSELSERDFLLILDEYDRTDYSDEVQYFVERLSDRFPRHGRLVINSRTLPRLPWVSMIAQGRASLLKDNSIVSEEFYGVKQDEKYEDGLEVYALGPGFVMTESSVIDNWEGHLPRLLFFFALDRPIVTRSEICQSFWPELDADQAVNVFHVTKRRLHKALDADVLIHDSGYYRVNPELPVYYDVMEFVDVLMRSRQTDDIETQMDAWERAIALYRGPFLQGHHDQWIQERRVEFRDGYLEAVSNMAEVWRQQDRKELALALLQKSLNAARNREDIHRKIMALYAELGRRSEIASHYQWLQGLRESEGTQLTPETQSLYGELMT